MKDKKQIRAILRAIPHIKALIRQGYGWDEVGGICTTLGLTDTAFRDYPSVDDYLLKGSYWRKQLRAKTRKIT